MEYRTTRPGPPASQRTLTVNSGRQRHAESRRAQGTRELAFPEKFYYFFKLVKHRIGNDPSAGSPTETLLRLLLPLNAQVWESSRATLEA